MPNTSSVFLPHITAADEKPTLSQLHYMSYTDERGQTMPFRFMDRIRPNWRSIAIELQFPSCFIKALKGEDDPVFHLLDEWLQGANQEHDTRPLTWRTLITVLRRANIQGEADILDLITEPAQETESPLGQYSKCCLAASSVRSSYIYIYIFNTPTKH